MAAKKRYSPNPSQVLGTPSLGSNQQIATPSVVGAAPPARSNPLLDLVKPLENFNRSLVGYQLGKLEKASVEAGQHYAGMEQTISDKSYGFKKYLRQAGFSQWANPWVYSKQITNLAGNTASKDAVSVTQNQDFLLQLNSLTRNSDNFENDANALIDRFKPERTAEFEQEGAYWDMGYAPKWIAEKNRIVANASAKNTEYQQLKVRSTFFESGRQALLDSVTLSQQSVEEGGGITNAKKAFRNFINNNFSSFPDDEIKFNSAVFENVIKPIFQELADRGDDLENVADLYDQLSRLTRDDEKTGQRISMFKSKTSDIDPSDEKYESFNSFWRTLEDNYDKAQSKKTTQIAAVRNNLMLKVQSDLNSLQSFKEEHPELISRYGLDGVTFPYDVNNKDLTRRLASAFFEAYDKDGSSSKLAGTHAEDHRVFYNVFSTMTTAANGALVTGAENSEKAQAAWSSQMSQQIGTWLQDQGLAEDLVEYVNKSIGGRTTASMYPAEFLKKEGVDKLQKRFYDSHPHIKRGSIAFASAIDQYMQPKIANAGIMRAAQLISIINSRVKNGSATKDDADSLRDAALEINDTDTENKLKFLMGEVETQVDNSAQFKTVKTTENIDTLLNRTIADLMVNDPDIREIQEYNEHKWKTETSLSWQFTEEDKQLAAAAQNAMQWYRNEALQIVIETSKEVLTNKPADQDKETWWAATGQSLANDTAVERLKLLKDSFKQKFSDETIQVQSADQFRSQTEGGALNPQDAELHNNQEFFTEELSQFNSNQAGLNTTEAVINNAQSDAPLLEKFFTGQKGQNFWNRIGDSNRAAKASVLKHQSNYHQAVENLKEAENNKSAVQIQQARTNLEVRAEELKTARLAFTLVPWETISENNYKLPVDAFGTQGELQINSNDLNFNKVLFFGSVEEMDEISDMLQLWEDDPDFLQAQNETVTDPKTKEVTVQRGDTFDPKLAPEKLQKVAQFIQKSTGINILEPNETKRAEAHKAFDKFWDKQARMLMTRMPEKMPPHLFKALQHTAVSNFVKNDSLTFNGIEFEKEDQTHVKGVFKQNETILSGAVNIEDGITFDRFIEFYRQSTGNTSPIRNSWGGRMPWEKNGAYRSKKAREQAIIAGIADEMAKAQSGGAYLAHDPEINAVVPAYTDRGLIGKTHTYKSSGVVPQPDEASGMVNLNSKTYKDNYKRIHTLLTSLSRFKDTRANNKNTELAKIYNSFAIGLKNNYFVRPTTRKVIDNVWGITPMLIPNKPAPLINKTKKKPTPDLPPLPPNMPKPKSKKVTVLPPLPEGLGKGFDGKPSMKRVSKTDKQKLDFSPATKEEMEAWLKKNSNTKNNKK